MNPLNAYKELEDTQLVDLLNEYHDMGKLSTPSLFKKSKLMALLFKIEEDWYESKGVKMNWYDTYSHVGRMIQIEILDRVRKNNFKN